MLQRSSKISRADIDGVYNSIVQNMNSTLAELKTMVEQERVAEEQERLRKIQVNRICCMLVIIADLYVHVAGFHSVLWCF